MRRGAAGAVQVAPVKPQVRVWYCQASDGIDVGRHGHAVVGVAVVDVRALDRGPGQDPDVDPAGLDHQRHLGRAAAIGRAHEAEVGRGQGGVALAQTLVEEVAGVVVGLHHHVGVERLDPGQGLGPALEDEALAGVGVVGWQIADHGLEVERADVGGGVGAPHRFDHGAGGVGRAQVRDQRIALGWDR